MTIGGQFHVVFQQCSTQYYRRTGSFGNTALKHFLTTYIDQNRTFFRDEKKQDYIHHEPLGFHNYNCLQMNAFCVVSDFGTLPEGLDMGCFILSDIDTVGLLQAVNTTMEMVKNEPNAGVIPVSDYVDENVTDKVVKIIQGYVEVVNKMVWRK